MNTQSTSTLAAIARPRLVRRCGTCAHGGEHFRMGRLGTHLHCCHPDKDVRDIPPQDCGWGTLREWYATCKHWTNAKTTNQP